jgi:hypothetical protein
MPYIVRLTPEGWLKRQEEQNTAEVADDVEVQNKDVKGSAKRSAWARLINKVYGIDPLICEKCGSDMRIVAFIMEPEQIDRIMQHLINRGRAPPGITESSTI